MCGNNSNHISNNYWEMDFPSFLKTICGLAIEPGVRIPKAICVPNHRIDPSNCVNQHYHP